MKKNYIAHFQFDGIQANAKEGVKVIESVMRESLGKQTVRNIDYDEWIELTFNLDTTFDSMTKITDKVFDRLKNSDLKFSCNVSEHTPKLIVKPLDFGSDEKFSTVLESIYEKNDGLGSQKISISKDEKDEALMTLVFNSMDERNGFKEKYEAAAKEVGLESVVANIDWNEVPVIQRDSYSYNKRKSSTY